MSDLVQRLRDEEFVADEHLCREAADEIERLRKLFTWIEEEYEEDTLAGDIARKALAGNDG